MRKVLIHHNFKRETIVAKQTLVQILRQRNIDIVTDDPDLIISIGGDGTMLNAIRKHREKNIPFIGVNTGSLGFLPTLSIDQLEKFSNDIIDGNYLIESHPIIKVLCETVRGEKIERYAFNEVVIKQAEPRILEAEIYFNDKLFNHFTGDGLIVSTPIGTTGYAIWAGGASIHPAIKALQIIPLNPNDNAVNHPFKTSMIIPSHIEVTVVVLTPKRRAVVLGYDGIKISKYAIARAEMSVMENSINIVKWHPNDYFDLYRKKIIDKNSKMR